MALPSDLKRKSDRIYYAPSTGAWWWQCQRGHKKRGSGATRSDAEGGLHDHDEEFHYGTRRRPVAEVTLGEAIAERVRYIEGLVEGGKKNAATLKEYRDCGERLVNVLGKHRRVAEIDEARCRWFITQRFAGRGLSDPAKRSKTQGHNILRDLEYLHRYCRAGGIMPAWAPKQFLQDIKPAKLQKVKMAKEDVVLFVRTLEPLTRAVVRMMVRTSMRLIELRELRVGDVDLKAGTVTYVAHCKRSDRRPEPKIEIRPLPDDVLADLRPLVKDKHPSAFVFEIKGRQLGPTSLRKRVRKAWRKCFYDERAKRWKYAPSDNLSHIRHQVASEMKKALGLEVTSRVVMGHGSESVTSRHYILEDEETLRAKLDERRVALERNAVIFPI